MGQSIRAWIGLTAVVALVVVVAGWFLLISPTRASTADARVNIQSEEDRSIVLTKALDALKKEFAGLDANKAKLAALALQIPSTAETSEFRRALVDRAAKSGVTIVSISTNVPAAVPAAAGKPAPAATTAPANAATPTPTPSPAPGAAATAPSSGGALADQTFVGIPLEITVVGTYDAARAFIASLQTTDGRLFLVSDLGLVTQLDSPAASGRPKTAKGDVEVTVKGLLLALTPSSANSSGSASATASPTPSPAPLPSTQRNPFAPVG